MTPATWMPGPRGRRYIVTPHFLARWESRTFLPPEDIPAAILTARVFGRNARGDQHGLWLPAEERIVISSPARRACDPGTHILLTVMYPDHTVDSPPGTRRWVLRRFLGLPTLVDLRVTA